MIKVWLVSFRYKGKTKKDSVFMHERDALLRVNELLSNLVIDRFDAGDTSRSNTVNYVSNNVRWANIAEGAGPNFTRKALRKWSGSSYLVKTYGVPVLQRMVIR